MKRIFFVFLLFFFLFSGLVQAQYFNETVLERTFEENGFFFRPSWINPYGLDGFGTSAPGLLSHPLLDLQVNPAFAASDSLLDGYTYLNFRNTAPVKMDEYYYPLYYRCYYLPSPYFQNQSKEELEPLISLATFFRPFKIGRHYLTLGLTYQAIFKDEGYYSVPQSIYRSSPGYDFAGNKTAEVADADITDRYTGRDDMHNAGHFITLYSGLPLSNKMMVGIKASTVLFNRDGGYGNSYQWDNGMSSDEMSRYSSSETRDQGYSHWELAAGLNVIASKATRLGFSGGIVSGQADQDLEQTNSSLYQHGIVGTGTDWSWYDQAGSTIQSWGHTGRFVYGGFNLSTEMSGGRTLFFYYRLGRQTVDIDLASQIADSSSSDYYYSSTDWTSTSTSAYHLYDDRTGDGSKKGWLHQAGIYLRWRLSERAGIHFGLNLQDASTETLTREEVMADRLSTYYYESTNYKNEYSLSILEKKTLNWTMISHATTVNIPVLIRYTISPKVLLTFGINRNMSRWKVEEETLALFDYREQTEDGIYSKKTDFGERYHQPDQIETDVTTSVLAGVTVSPSDHLRIRLLTVPRFTNTWQGTTLSQFQWWLDFELIN